MFENNTWISHLPKSWPSMLVPAGICFKRCGWQKQETHGGVILPEIDISPENRPLEKEIPIGNHHFQGRSLLVSGRVFFLGWVRSGEQSRKPCVISRFLFPLRKVGFF